MPETDDFAESEQAWWRRFDARGGYWRAVTYGYGRATLSDATPALDRRPVTAERLARHADRFGDAGIEPWFPNVSEAGAKAP